MPTILGVLGIPVPPSVQGIDLIDRWQNPGPGDTPRALYCESLTPTKYGAHPLLGIVTETAKYIQSARPELYDLKLDPAEETNLAAAAPEKVERLRRELERLLAESRAGANGSGQVGMDEATRERLQSLGYVAGRTVRERFEFDETRADAKELIGYHEAFKEIVSLAGARDFDRARNLAREVLAAYPAAVDLHIVLGDIAFAVGSTDEAIGHYQTFLDRAETGAGTSGDGGDDWAAEYELVPELARAHFNLANALAVSGDVTAAVSHYRQTLEVRPQHIDARYNLAITLAGMGQIDEAIELFRLVTDARPLSDSAHYDLGYALALRGRYGEAEEQFAAALRCNPAHGPSHVALGDLLVAEGRLEKAAEHFEGAIEAQDDLLEAYAKLGATLLNLRRTADAIGTYRSALRRFPAWREGANTLALILATHPEQRYRSGAEAVALAEGICRQGGGERVAFLRTLAAAYAEDGQFDKAVATETRALELAKEAGRGDLDGMRERIGRYQDHRPWRTPHLGAH
jgi:tetratricopeptide (TPR) repeat protein